jgi:YVTN family beta-propeller protein
LAWKSADPYRWLGAGAVTLGMGIALAVGAGVAHADGGNGGGSPHAGVQRLYVVNYGAETVSVIDAMSRKVIGAPLEVGSGPALVAVSPDGKRVYVTNNGSDSVSVIDTGITGSVGHQNIIQQIVGAVAHAIHQIVAAVTRAIDQLGHAVMRV